MKIKLIAFALVLTMFATGCSAAWLTTFEGYLAIAAPVIINILEIVALKKGVVVNPATIAKVNADAAAVKTLVQSVKTAASGNIPNACAALNVGIATFAADVPTLEQVGRISDPITQAQVEDALTLVQSVFEEIETPIAACQTSGASYKTLAAASRITSASDFVGKYNKVMDRAKDTKKYEVHIHSKLTRVVTLGIAK